MPLPRLTRLAAAGAAVALLAGCGSSSTTVPARDGHVAMRLDDYLLDPQSVTATQGRVTFDVVNDGKVGHSFRVRQAGRDLLTITTLLPGERESATRYLPRGHYILYCAVGNHEELGMHGTLVVR